ncbi:helix-turn-helix domain-containing protein [Micromonospora aurantiaca (nom. illeg.)]|uniref:helix-turn-helix domain-containing protein n=1 Tax=Micromonospora aurantiaca (nom. illeg.) TaxID=47850 RepID=UPI0001BF28D6|nr:helix-turn-helix domain-containing protein [Micromonospora aurantiaca]ADL48494.1 regulatory protein MerR [Micromonospora aurantiaca ATCC 27029]
MTRAERAEGALLVAILVVVGGASGWASFTHVHDWTMANTPAGTPDAFGWVNAVVSELVPVAALLEIRRRRRAAAPVGYPLALLVAGGGLSLAAQLAVAKPSPSGWLLSAVPALAFTALVKLVFARTPAARPVAASASPVAAPPPAAASPLSPATRPATPTPRPRPPVVPPGVRALPLVAVVGTPPATPVPVAAPPTTAERVAAVLAETPGATPAQIAARLGVSERTARRYLPADKVPPARRRARRVPTPAAA